MPANKRHAHLGERFRSARMAFRGPGGIYSQEALAAKTGLTQSTISLIEQGLQEPKLSSLEQICRVLQTTPNDLLGWAPKSSTAENPDVAKLMRMLPDVPPVWVLELQRIVDIILRQRSN